MITHRAIGWIKEHCLQYWNIWDLVSSFWYILSVVFLWDIQVDLGEWSDGYEGTSAFYIHLLATYSPARCMLLLFPFHRWRNEGTELSKLPNIIQRPSDKAGFSLVPESVLSPRYTEPSNIIGCFLHLLLKCERKGKVAKDYDLSQPTSWSACLMLKTHVSWGSGP